MKVLGSGPIPARILICGEAPGEKEEEQGRPFVGPSGALLDRLLGDAGISRAECYVTNVCKVRPPNNHLPHFIPETKAAVTSAHTWVRDRHVSREVIEGIIELRVEIDMVKPQLIICFGNLAMWALTGEWGVMKWRGSQMVSDIYWNTPHGLMERVPPSIPIDLPDGYTPYKVLPSIHPAAILREWSFRRLVIQDLKRAAGHLYPGPWRNKPDWQFVIRPNYPRVLEVLDEVTRLLDKEETWLEFDIETRGRSHVHIDCIGFSWSKLEAICIPFMARGRPDGYWSAGEEAHIVYRLWKLLTHPNTRIAWHNGLYDAQIVYHNWHFYPRGSYDTMIGQHSAFSALPKALFFCASMYSPYYRYWKDEGKIASDRAEDERWNYNLQDCYYTRQVRLALAGTLAALGLADVDRRQQSLFWPVLRAMERGVRIDTKVRGEMAQAVQEALSDREAFLFRVLGHPLNTASPKQMATFFYEDLGQRPVLKAREVKGRRVYTPSCDDEALTKIGAREPLLRPVCNAIADMRTLEKLGRDFIMMPVSEDGRMRCSFNIAGDAGGKSAPYSYRLSSSKNPLGSGGNLQTIPSEKSKSIGKFDARGSMDFEPPNIRKMFVPDPGFTFFDMDLDRADLQVVVWETNDATLKEAIRLGVDIHLLNVFTLDGQSPPPLEELSEGHSRYMDHRGPRKHKREFAKVFCHATNYGGSAKTISEHTGRTVHEVSRAQAQWFGAHPAIKRWHEETGRQVEKRRYVENRFGYRWYIFDRTDGILPEALAWVPQSTVGIVINSIWLQFHQHLSEVQVLLQVHDSLAGQVPTHRVPHLLPLMRQHSRVVVPYDDPLIIPTGIKVSDVSWGDCA